MRRALDESLIEGDNATKIHVQRARIHQMFGKGERPGVTH